MCMYGGCVDTADSTYFVTLMLGRIREMVKVISKEAVTCTALPNDIIDDYLG